FRDGSARMFSEDTGFLLTDASGKTQFQTTVHIIGGTADYTDASGQIVASGFIDLSTGAGDGAYTGSICHTHQRAGCSGNDD
ncbi:MAG TPA: hypothetical protein VNO21_07415, partial [Polyangiaceae bacterium]|nr:hypothetical protein [Polyangiaceae bacterium]